jgi:hypothetical protein
VFLISLYFIVSTYRFVFQVSGEVLKSRFFAATFDGISMYFVGEHRGEDSMG